MVVLCSHSCRTLVKHWSYSLWYLQHIGSIVNSFMSISIFTIWKPENKGSGQHGWLSARWKITLLPWQHKKVIKKLTWTAVSSTKFVWFELWNTCIYVITVLYVIINIYAKTILYWIYVVHINIYLLKQVYRSWGSGKWHLLVLCTLGIACSLYNGHIWD